MRLQGMLHGFVSGASQADVSSASSVIPVPLCKMGSGKKRMCQSSTTATHMVPLHSKPCLNVYGQCRCQLGNKYGAELEDCEALYAAAKEHNVAIKGISFHVGSGATNPAAFAQAIAMAKK